MDGVVFDCDGVLADSEPASQAAWVSTLASVGHAAPLGEIARFVGSTEKALAEHFAPSVGMRPDDLERLAEDHFREYLARVGIESFPDTVAAIAGLEIPVAVGSNSFRWRLDAVLGAVGLDWLIAHSVAGDEVARAKPAPDVYLAACARIGSLPQRVLAVEDSPTGIASAKAAGCSVVAISRGMFDPAMLVEADLVVGRFDVEHPVHG